MEAYGLVVPSGSEGTENRVLTLKQHILIYDQGTQMRKTGKTARRIYFVSFFFKQRLLSGIWPKNPLNSDFRVEKFRFAGKFIYSKFSVSKKNNRFWSKFLAIIPRIFQKIMGIITDFGGVKASQEFSHQDSILIINSSELELYFPKISFPLFADFPDNFRNSRGFLSYLPRLEI